MTRDIPAAVAALQAHFGERASSGLSQREQHAHTTTWIAPQLPDLVVFAESTEDVQHAVQICAEQRCPIIPFGVGTSLEGQLNAPEGGISIDFSRMDAVLDINAEDLTVTVQPGITREALNVALRDTGLFFPIDPGANASIGGMTATRASGTNAVRYGTMRENVMALEIVNAQGQIVRTGTRAKKSSAGYDLTHLMVGSEGTLGITTAITLRLQGVPERIVSGSATFPSIDAACKTVIDTIQLGLPVARIELLDPMQVQACNQYSQLTLPEAPLLLVEFHGSDATVDEQLVQFGELAADHGCNQIDTADSLEERNRLWQARHDAYWAARALKPGCTAHSTDACVPISRLAECISETREDLDANCLTAPILGHVGDGNFHVLLLLDESDADEISRAKGVVERLAARAINMGGTCTGEHGIGQGKQRYLRDELGDAVPMMAAIKRALDPDNILNPGKIFALDTGGTQASGGTD